MPWGLVIVLCAAPGLSRFAPEPHIREKLMMPAAGELVRGIDWFDRAQHGAPWHVLIVRGARTARAR